MGIANILQIFQNKALDRREIRLFYQLIGTIQVKLIYYSRETLQDILKGCTLLAEK